MSETRKGHHVPVKTFKAAERKLKTMSLNEMKEFVSGGGSLIGRGGSGEEYLMSNQQYLISPDITGKDVYDSTLNKYIAKGVESLMTIRFTDKPAIKVFDENGLENPDLGKQATRVFDADDVELFARIKLSSKDAFQWGCSLYQNAWGNIDGEVVPTQIKRLPPETFLKAPSVPLTKSEILPGIGIDATGKMQFWQTWSDMQTHLLSDVKIIRDPTMPGMTGQSRLLPLIPLVRLMDFAWKAQAQKVNRVGAPALFIKFTSPPVVIPNKRNDITLARLILDNWGKESQYILRDNMEVVQLDFPDNQSALETIDRLGRDIMEHFNPATFLVREGEGTIGGSDTGKVNLIRLAIQSSNEMIADAWEPLIEEWLLRNGFEFYTAQIIIPVPEPDKTQVNMQIADVAARLGVASFNEQRKLLSLPEADDALRAEIAAENQQKAARIPGVFQPGAPPADAAAGVDSGNAPDTPPTDAPSPAKPVVKPRAGA